MSREEHLASGNAGVDARLAGARAERLGLLAVVVALEGLADLLGAGGAGVGDGGGVAVVGVDAHKVGGNAVDLDVADHDIAWAAVVGAVATAAVDLADVDEGRVPDGHGSTAVVLNDLVACRGRSATLPEDVAVSER